MKNSFSEFRQQMPHERFGNGIDWMAAEHQGKIKLVDFIEGVSIKRKQFKKPEDFKLTSTEQKMPKIIFSHERHAVWNGCERAILRSSRSKRGGNRTACRRFSPVSIAAPVMTRWRSPISTASGATTDTVY